MVRRKCFVALGALALAAPALGVGALVGAAEPVRVLWSVATSYLDGAPLPAGAIEAHVVQWGVRGGPYSAGARTVPMPLAEMPLPALPPGETCFVVRTVLSDAEVARKGARKESDASAEACVTILYRVSAPSNVRVQ